MRQLHGFAPFIAAHAEFEIRIRELSKHTVGRVGHFMLHGKQLFFAGTERVRLVADQPLQLQPKSP